MPVLPYCMVEAEAEVAAPAAGVRGAAVAAMAEAGVRCFYSVLERAPEKLTKDDALAFYAVVREVFARTGVLPFRFPTLLENEIELEEYLITNAGEHLDVLQRLRDRVQMEVRLTHAAAEGARAGSGKKRLELPNEARLALEQAAAAAREQAGDLLLGWREHDSAAGLRCFGLTTRTNADAFRQALHGLHLPHPVHAVVSGPWPPTEFLQDTESAPE